MKQRIKLTRTQVVNESGKVCNVLGYLVSDYRLRELGSPYSLITEDALLIGWSTEAEEGVQSTVGIVLLESRQVITVGLSCIVFV